MKKNAPKQSISAFSSLTMFALFAVCILCVLLSGVGVYRRLVTGGQENYAQRTCTQYISAKVRQCRSGNELWVEPFGQTQALVLGSDVEEDAYVTRVYCYEGWLMELFADREEDFVPEDGEKLLPAKALAFQKDGSVLEAELVDEFGEVHNMVFFLRGREGDG